MPVIMISNERYSSSHYLVRPGQIGCPFVIDATDCGVNDATLKCIRRICRTLGFGDPLILKCGTDMEYETEAALLKKLGEIANPSPENGIQEGKQTDDALLCFVIGDGQPGSFYLYDKKRIDDDKPSEIPLTSVINVFKGDRCPRLVLKPKVFIVQTSRKDLELVEEAEHGDEETPPSKPYKVPVEADILYYQSTFSDKYTWNLWKENNDAYNDLAGKGLVDKSDSNQPASHFLYTLSQALGDVPDKFEFNELIFKTNSALQNFISKDYWKPEENNWNIPPSLPLCCYQLTKKFYLEKQSADVK